MSDSGAPKIIESLSLITKCFEAIERRAPRGSRPGVSSGSERIGERNALLSGFAVFHLKMPSLLSYDSAREEENFRTMYGISKAPSDTRMREILDEVNPLDLRPCFSVLFHRLREQGHLRQFRVLGGRYAVSVDGTEYFTSDSVHCEQCMTKEHRDGQVTYHHQMLGASLVKPGLAEVVPFAPEPIMNTDGSSKNDCETAAFSRFLKHFVAEHPKLPTVFLLDSLHSKAPTIRAIKKYSNYSFVMAAKEGDHRYLFKRIDEFGYDAQHQWEDEKGTTYACAYRNDLSINESNQDVRVNFIELQIKSKRKNRSKAVRFCFVTDIAITEENYREILAVGRARWKVENETFNTLKNQGYNYEHNFGHGNKNLSSVFSMLMMLAFLVDQVQEITCKAYQDIRFRCRTKQALFNYIRTFFEFYILADGWKDLYKILAKKKAHNTT